MQEFIRRHGLYETSPALRGLPRAPEYIALVSDRLRPRTRRHSLGVAGHLLSFAGDIGVTEEQAMTAGLLHDLGKSFKKRELLDQAARYGIVPTDCQRGLPELLHGPVGAEECRRELGIDDEDVSDAIYWHTTGRENLCALGLGLYVADFSDPTRTFPEAAVVRNVLTSEGFPQALVHTAALKLERLRSQEAPFDPATESFCTWLKQKYPGA